jgi:hypothetical protein
LRAQARALLPGAALVPNHTVRHLIKRWLSSDHHQIPDATDDNDAEEPSLVTVTHCL